MKLGTIASHVEFTVVFVTLIGGFYTLDSKIERQGARIDRQYEIICENQKDFHDKFYVMHQEIRDLIRHQN